MSHIKTGLALAIFAALATALCWGGMLVVKHDKQQNQKYVAATLQLIALSDLAPEIHAGMDRDELRAVLERHGYNGRMTEFNDRFEIQGFELQLDPYGKLHSVRPRIPALGSRR